MKKWVIAVVLVLAATTGVMVAQVVSAQIDKATLRARVAFLEQYIKAPETISETEAQELLGRLNKIGVSQSVSTPTIQAIALKLAELESQIPGGVISAQEASKMVGQRTNVYGTVEKSYQGTDKNGSPYVTHTLRGGFQVTWFRADKSHPLYNLRPGVGLVVSGTVGTYNNAPQIIINSPEDVVLGQ